MLGYTRYVSSAHESSRDKLRIRIAEHVKGKTDSQHGKTIVSAWSFILHVQVIHCATEAVETSSRYRVPDQEGTAGARGYVRWGRTSVRFSATGSVSLES